MPEPITKHQCSACDEVHDDHLDAEECCKPEVYDIYVCPICNTEYEFKEHAIECIKSCAEDEGIDPLMASKEELERAGQQTLPI